MAIKGKNLEKELLIAGNRAVFDLSDSAATETVLYHKNYEILIHKVWVQYVEATSADAGVEIKIGSPSDDNAYFSLTSVVSQDALSSTEYGTGDMVLATVPKDTPVCVAHAGGKTGTGTAYVWFSYTLQ